MPRERIKGPAGRARAYRVTGRGRWRRTTGWAHNAVLFEWATVMGNLLLRRGVNYGISGMYLEYENVAAPGNPVDPPDFTRNPEEGVEYYNNLALSANRDYLRVPLTAGSLTSSDTAKYPGGNLLTFFAQSQGAQGVHGKSFSDVVNSTVYGGALVAMVDDTDWSQDLVFSRFYFAVGEQQLKLPSSQVGLEWVVTLK